MNIFKRKIKGKFTHKPSEESAARRKAYPRRPVIKKKGKFRGTTARWIVTHTKPNRHARRYAAAITRSIRKLARSRNG